MHLIREWRRKRKLPAKSRGMEQLLKNNPNLVPIYNRQYLKPSPYPRRKHD